MASFATPVRARFLSDRNLFCILGEGQKRPGVIPLGLFLLRRGLVIPFFFPCFFFFFGGHLPQTSGFRSAKEILVVSFATQPRAFILSGRNIFYTPPGGDNGGV